MQMEIITCIYPDHSMHDGPPRGLVTTEELMDTSLFHYHLAGCRKKNDVCCIYIILLVGGAMALIGHKGTMPRPLQVFYIKSTLLPSVNANLLYVTPLLVLKEIGIDGCAHYCPLDLLDLVLMCKFLLYRY